MKTLICTAPGNFRYQSGDEPELLENTAIIKIKRIGICGTDLHAYEGNQPYFTYPRILGHELAAQLMSFDNAPGFSQGEAVTFIPYFNCGKCIACHSGKPNCCVNLKVCGVHTDGGMVEYLRVPSHTLVHGDGLSYDELALVEPLAIGAHGVGRADIREGEFVVITGAGPIGLGTIEFARIAGGKVIVIDTSEPRLKFCRNELGLVYTINPTIENAVERVSEITGDEMAGVVIDCTGNLHAINGGINYLAHSGRYVLIGLQKEAFSFSHPEFHKREATLMSSRNATRRDFEKVKQCLKEGQIKAKIFITHQATFDEIKDEFDNWLDPSNGVIKAMVKIE